MRDDQLSRLSTLHDKLIEVALRDADPENWTAGSKKLCDMTREERGDAKWCRSTAVTSVALTMQVQRMMQSPSLGGAIVTPETPATPAARTDDQDEEASIEAEIHRYEKAAAAVIERAKPRNAKR